MIVYESLKMTQGKLCIKEENSLAKKKKKNETWTHDSIWIDSTSLF